MVWLGQTIVRVSPRPASSTRLKSRQVGIVKTIADQANTKACDRIMMGTRGMGTIGNLLMGSMVTKVNHLADVRVMLVK